jgi:GntR family transcriptional regulator/MocR family aminotransferase
MFTPDQNRQQAVFDRLRQGILAGTLPANARLPPTRALAEELGVARQTVVLAYERLASEGYVRARTGSGTFVAPELPDAAPVAAMPPPNAASPLSRRGQRVASIPVSPTLPDRSLGTLLAGGIPAPDLFPREAWARCAAPAGTAQPDRGASGRDARTPGGSCQHRGHRRNPAGAADRG